MNSNLEKYYTDIYIRPNLIIQDYYIFEKNDLFSVFERKKEKYFILYNNLIYSKKFDHLDDLLLFGKGFIYIGNRNNLYYLDEKIVSNMAIVNLEIKNNTIYWKNSNNNYKIVFINETFSDVIKFNI